MTVARAVGVSPTTVSNAYNRPQKLTPALRERILAAARELGYPGPDPAARSLRRGRAGSIGLLFGEALTYVFQDPGAVEFLRGLAEGTARDTTVLQLIAALDADGEQGASLLANAIVDGLVVWTLPERHPLLRLARERHIPLVTHGSPRLAGVRPRRRRGGRPRAASSTSSWSGIASTTSRAATRSASWRCCATTRGPPPSAAARPRRSCASPARTSSPP